jgi:hypothetical protein
MPIATNLLRQITMQTHKPRLKMEHLQQLLECWQVALCIMSRVPPNLASAPNLVLRVPIIVGPATSRGDRFMRGMRVIEDGPLAHRVSSN